MFARVLPRTLRSIPRTSIHIHQTPLHPKPSPHASLRPQWPTPSQHRPITTRAAARKLWRENPFSVTLAAFFILFGASCLVYSNYIYKYFILEQHAAYPEVVAQKLRKAIFYSSVDIQPRNAVKYYQQALLAAQEVGMDAFSDEVLGIKIKLSALMQNIGDVQRAIEVLEIIQRDCGEWMDDLARGGKDENRGRRTSVLKKMVGISVRIGELYADERMGNQEAAEEKLLWAVTTVLRERERREREGVNDGEGEWLSGEEIGAALECKIPSWLVLATRLLMLVVGAVALGSHYEARNQHFLAAPLFLQAIALIPLTNCHAITLMNNLSISLALQNPPPTGGMPSSSSTAQIDSARTWAQKALDVDQSLRKSPTRTEECDMACAVTRINLGEFAEMEGDISTARKTYEQGMEFSKKIGFQEGAMRGREAIIRLDKRKA